MVLWHEVNSFVKVTPSYPKDKKSIITAKPSWPPGKWLIITVKTRRPRSFPIKNRGREGKG